ncbi:MAG: T9SS type A sorting domain-containing protein, partial [Bacteroidetes bacterium]|nr:T9SS type A sorting domain-containing protein [Bacteroidota bacterium]
SEDALAGFRIERTNGNDWTSISELIPAVSPSGGDYALTVRNALSAGTRFRLTSVDVDGTLAFSDVLEVSAALVDDYLVSDAFPNPFTATASIEVRVRDAQSVRVDLYDVLGRHVRTLDDATRSAGDQFSVAIERDGLAAGQYFVRVKGERFIETRTVVIAR